MGHVMVSRVGAARGRMRMLPLALPFISDRSFFAICDRWSAQSWSGLCRHWTAVFIAVGS